MAEKSGYTHADSGYLLSGTADACAYGATDWTESNGSWRAEWPVSAKNVGDGTLILLMRINPRRPSEPSVVYMVRGDNMRRVDVNGAHKGDRFSHIQGADTSGEVERTTPVPDHFVTVEHGPADVGGDIYRRVFQDAAKLFHVDVAAVDWVDPPEGGAS